MEMYEQQYLNLTAEITSKIRNIPNLSGDEKKKVSLSVEKLMEETKELLEQMQLEVPQLPATQQQKYGTWLNSYKSELNKLEKDLRKSKFAFSDSVYTREELFGEDSHTSEDQRQRLLENTEQLERSGRRLERSYQTTIETEDIGRGILDDLHSQRDILQKSRDRLRETNENLGKSSRVLSGMMKRIIQNRILLVGLFVVTLVIIGVVLYFTTKKKSDS